MQMFPRGAVFKPSLSYPTCGSSFTDIASRNFQWMAADVIKQESARRTP